MAGPDVGLTAPLDLLAHFGLSTDATPERLSGGDMGEVHRVGRYVTKSHPSPPAGLFPAEARGLARLAESGVRVPVVHAVSEAGIVLEWLGDGPRDMAALGALIAHMHSVPRPRYGSSAPLFLGRFPLPAGQSEHWQHLHWTHRTRPLLEATREVLGPVASLVEQVADEFEFPVEGPVLVHGDLWSGNVHFGTDGPALIDPCAHAAERVVDLAMMTLFGGFPSTFWRAYEDARPIPPAVRRAIPAAQLPFLLAHVHFFGRSYIPATANAARSCLAH